MIAKHDERVSERGAPRERDLEIYAAVRVDGRRQVDVAAALGITQGRVSQIVRSVQRWRAGMGLEAELERRDRQAVDRWLEELRIDKLYEETMELFRQSCQPRRKERRGKDHRGEWSSETIDHGPGNLQCLKLAGRLIALRREVDVEPPRPDQSANSSRSHMDEYEAFRLLVEMRNDAITRGDVPEGEISEYVVRRMIGELVGRKEHVSPHERAAEEFDFAAREADENVGQDSSCQAERQDEQRQDSQATERQDSQATERQDSQATERQDSQATERQDSQATERQDNQATERQDSQATERQDSQATERQDSQATERQDSQATERQDKSCPTDGNAAAIITDISAAGAREVSTTIEPTTCAAASCDEARMSGQPSAGANNRQILQMTIKPDALPACVLAPVESVGQEMSSRLRRTTAG
jgi:hypothetical protein